MEEGRIYKKYNCHIIIYKDLLNQSKQPRQYDKHIKTYLNKIRCEKRELLLREYERKRQIEAK